MAIPSIRVFLDSDVVISAILSQTGAAHSLLKRKPIFRLISNLSLEELKIVVERKGISSQALSHIVSQCHLVRMSIGAERIANDFGAFVTDPGDAHIVAGAKKGRAQFLLTYNKKDYKADRIKEELGLAVLAPAQLLQYLRSLK